MLVNFYKFVQKCGYTRTVAEPTILDTQVRQRLQTAAFEAVRYNQISPVLYSSAQGYFTMHFLQQSCGKGYEK
jgi:hypothetical protein